MTIDDVAVEIDPVIVMLLKLAMFWKTEYAVQEAAKAVRPTSITAFA